MNGMRKKKIIRSDLSHTHASPNLTVEVCIYSISSMNGWALEVLCQDGRSAVWSQVFRSDEEAFDAFVETLAEIGLSAILEHQTIPKPTQH